MSRRPPSPLVKRGHAEKRLGIEELAKRLGAAESTIRSWQTGAAEMSDKEFLLLVDILTEHAPEFWTRGFEP
jgi:ribosome-binding protein aMBF1 (putative translation factor)